MTWREELHPRDERGRFAHKSAMPAVSIKATMANLAMASDDDLLDVFHRLSVKRQLDKRALDAIDKELARRDGTAELAPPDDTPEQKQIDDMVRRGASYAEAYAEAYGLSQRTIAGQQVDTLTGRQKGETREQAVRRGYAEMVAVSALQAEEATRGNLLSKRCQGIDPATLWSGPAARARKCASEELMRWWEGNGGRTTYTEWRAKLGVGGTRTRQAAEKARLGGSGRDFGV